MKFDPVFKVFRHRETISVPAPVSAAAPDGRRTIRVMASGATKSECKARFEKKRTKAIQDAERGAVATPKGGKTFAEFAREWLATYPSSVRNRENTKISKEYHVRVRLIPYFEKLAAERGGAPFLLRDLTPRVIDRLIADLSDAPRISRAKDETRALDRKRGTRPRRGALVESRPLSAKSVSNIAQTLRKMLVSAKRWDEIDAAPEVPQVKLVRPKFDFFTFDEADRLLAAVGKGIDEGAPGAMEDHALILTALRTGPRAGELLALQWTNLDFVKREIRIEGQLHRTIRNRIEPPKAGSRTVPMSALLAAALRARKHLRISRSAGAGPEGNHWVFCDEGGEHFSRGHLRRLMARWCRRAGLRVLHPHGLRHTFASHLVMRGVPLKQIQEWLGHSSINMTMRYAHLAPGVGSEQINLLDGEAPTFTVGVDEAKKWLERIGR